MTIGTFKSSTSKPKRLSTIKLPAVVPPPRTQKSITVFGNFQVSTAQSKYGTGSALADGAGDYFQITNFNSSPEAIANDFTIESWVRFNIMPGSQTVGGGSYFTLFFSQTGGSGIEPYVLIDNNASNNPEISVGFTNGVSASYGVWRLTTTTITTGVWYHIALVRKNGEWRAYWNGVDMGSITSGATNWPPASNVEPIKPVSNWAGWPQTGRGYWNGNIDELRVSCIARYSGNFTPPAQAFVNDEATLLLLHFEGDNGSQAIIDDIGT